MTGELRHLCQRRVLPYDDVVLRITMSAHQLVGTLRPGEVAHLRVGVDRLERLARDGVPEPNGLVSRAPTRGQDAVLVGGPGDGLDGCRMIHVALEGDL